MPEISRPTLHTDKLSTICGGDTLLSRFMRESSICIKEQRQKTIHIFLWLFLNVHDRYSILFGVKHAMFHVVKNQGMFDIR